MFGLFGGKKKKFVGIDIGTSSIKIVELGAEKNKPKLLNYGEAVFDTVKMLESRLSSFSDLETKALQQLVSEMDLHSRGVHVSLPGYAGLATLIEFPVMKKEELNEAINFEAHRYIPTSLEEVAISWDIVQEKEALDQVGKSVKKLEVLLVAAPKKEVERREQVVLSAGLKVDAVELEIFSLVRSLVGNDPGSFIVIDIGARATNIMLTEKGVIKMNRNIDTGGNEITATLSETMNISKQRAELLKKEGKDFLNTRESSVVFHSLDLVANEVLRIMNIFKSKNQESKIDQVILTGGASEMIGLEQFFSRILGVSVVIGNPWKRVEITQSASEMVQKLGSSYAVAIGLALRGFEENSK